MFCMPISIRGTVIGVVQMINKIGGDGVFTQEDEATMSQFVAYIGSALHHAKLYDKIRKSEQKCKVTQKPYHHILQPSPQVTQEVLTYHNQASQQEVETLMAEGVPTIQGNEDIST